MIRAANGRQRSPHRLSLGLVLVPIVLTLAALTGCTQGSSPPLPSSAVTATGGATVSPASPQPSPSATPTPPPLPPEAQRPTTRGAAAFFRYFFALYDYGFQTLDSRPLELISLSSCGFCRNTVGQIDEAHRSGLTYRGEKVIVQVAVAGPGDMARGLIVNAVIDSKGSTILERSGRTKGTTEAIISRRVDAVVRWEGAGWKMLAVKVFKDGTG